MKPSCIVRPARVDTDLGAIARLINPFETHPVSEDRLREWFEYNPPGRIQLRLAAVDENDQVTGYACAIHEASKPAHTFYIWLVVDEAFRHRGIGSDLWGACRAFLREQGADELESEVTDDDPLALSFARQCGFEIDRHLFHSTLDLTVYDETPLQPEIAALEARGIQFCSLADFPDTAETRRKLYDLNVANVLDIPGNHGAPWTFADFENFVIGAPWFSREGQLLAVDGDRWVALAAVSIDREKQSAYNLHTGVARAYRGQKIAQAMKVMAARYALRQGARELSTDNDSLNAPILAINRKMGYQPKSGKYLLTGRLA